MAGSARPAGHPRFPARRRGRTMATATARLRLTTGEEPFGPGRRRGRRCGASRWLPGWPPGRGRRRWRPATCSRGAGQGFGPGQSLQAAADEEAVPAAAVLVGRGGSVRRRRRRAACRREAWISMRAMRPCTSAFGGQQAGQDAAQALGFLAEGRAHPVFPRWRVALVEDQVDDLQHRSQAADQFRPRGTF